MTPPTTTRCAVSDASSRRSSRRTAISTSRTNVRTGEPDRVGYLAVLRGRGALGDRTVAERAARSLVPHDGASGPRASSPPNATTSTSCRSRPLNDHWASYGFAEMADWPLGDAEADYARSVYGRFQLLIRWEAHRRTQARRTRGRTDRNAAPPRWAHGSKVKAPSPASRASTTGSTICADLTLDSTAVWCRGARRTSARLRRRRDRRRVVHRQREPHGRPAARDLGPARPRLPARGQLRASR